MLQRYCRTGSSVCNYNVEYCKFLVLYCLSVCYQKFLKGKMCAIPEPNFYNNFVTWANLERLLHSLSYSSVDTAADRRASPLQLGPSLTVASALRD